MYRVLVLPAVSEQKSEWASETGFGLTLKHLWSKASEWADMGKEGIHTPYIHNFHEKWRHGSVSAGYLNWRGDDERRQKRGCLGVKPASKSEWKHESVSWYQRNHLWKCKEVMLKPFCISYPLFTLKLMLFHKFLYAKIWLQVIQN